VPGAPAAGARPGEAAAENPPFFLAPKYSFVVQFCWQEKQLTDRLRARQEALTNQQEDQIVPEEQEGTEPEATESPLTTQPGD
jgi:hypothetical protein